MIKIKTFKKFLKENKKIEELLFNKQIIFYFKYKNILFGSKEEDRIIFAKIKSKEKRSPLDYSNNIFEGYDLKMLLNNETKIKKFNKKMINKIKVITQEEAIKELKNE